MRQTQSVRDRLLKANIKPSYHRVRVFEYLMATTAHPTAEDVFEELVKEIPTLSRTTVHNTLNLLVDAGLAHLVTIEAHQKRFDGTTARHGHFQCRQCGKVYDFLAPTNGKDPPELEGFLIEDRELYFRGVCRDCQERETKKGGTDS